MLDLLVALTSFALLLALSAIANRSFQRRRYVPLAVATVVATVVITGVCLWISGQGEVSLPPLWTWTFALLMPAGTVGTAWICHRPGEPPLEQVVVGAFGGVATPFLALLPLVFFGTVV